MAGSNNYVLGGITANGYIGYDDRSSPTKGYVTSNSSVGTTATLVFQITEGPGLATASLNGAQITVVGCSNSANFNVTNVTILTAVTNTLTGVCTVTYTVSSTTQSSTPDFGQVIVPAPEIGETPAAGGSVPLAVPSIDSTTNQGRTIVADVTFPTVGTMTNTITLQGALQDIDGDYETVPTTPANVQITGGTITNGQTQMVAPDTGANFRFYRLFQASVTAGSGTICGKIKV